jgi:LysR family glycine cleavage system transcriptional activator
MSDRLPSLKTLHVFEAAARRLSYSRAAEELFLTHGAVSHQIKALEAELGTKLFRRAGRVMLLTEDGQNLYRAVHDALVLIGKGVTEVRRDDRPQTLNVSATPSLATGWLVPRLADFQRRHPHMEINLNVAIALVDFSHDDVDLALRYGRGVWPGVHAERLPLPDIEYLAVCSPTYRNGRLPATAQALRQCILIHHPFMSWEEWFKSAGMDVAAPIRGPRFNDYMLAMQAAVAGQGVMLAHAILIANELAGGRLVRLLRRQPALRKSSGYYIVYPEGRELSPKARVFHDWLLEQARVPMGVDSSLPGNVSKMPPSDTSRGTPPARKRRS